MSEAAPKYLTCYSANGPWYVPDVKIEAAPDFCALVPTRGYSASLIVIDLKTRRCVGWIDTRTLGYEMAREWMAATKWTDQGF